MANSSLATYRNHTSQYGGKRQGKITKITPHYMATYWTGKQCADYFATCGREASSNYCVGVNGDIAVSVDEINHPWTSSDWKNDDVAVTIECGNNSDSSLPSACYNALVALCADICKRNGINPHYDGTTNGTITMHKQFASTSCPGSWLSQKITSGQFEKDIKAKMGTTATTPTTTTNGKYETYTGYVKVTYSGSDGLAIHSKASWSDSTICQTVKKNEVFTIIGRQKVDGVYMYKIKSGKWITSSAKYVQYMATLPQATTKKSNEAIADEVIAGKWGNGSDRINRLKQAGYNPTTIQQLVNKKLGY